MFCELFYEAQKHSLKITWEILVICQPKVRC